MDGVALSFDDDALDYIVEKAIEFKLGARGLRSLCESVMTDTMFDAPSSDIKSLNITREYAREKIERSAVAELHKVL